MLPTGPEGTAGSDWPARRGNPSLVTRHLQEERQRVGLTIGRRRLTIAATTNNNNDDLLLFRRGDDANATASNNFLEISSPYKTVAFLNNDVVLASDHMGRLDAVRVPPNRGERRGTLVSSRSGEPAPAVQSSAPSLFALHDGDSFAMGLPGGEIRIFATEYDKTWGNWQQQQTQSNTYLRQALQVGGSRRKYERADCYKRAGSGAGRSLYDMLGAPSSNDRYLQEICDWNEGKFPPLRCPDGNNTDSSCLTAGLVVTANSFAFHEDVSGRSLWCAYVDPELDCFSLRVLDERVSSETTDTRRTICVDTNPLKKRSPDANIFEDISATTFVGDRTLATSHVGRIAKNQVSNVIKLWDLRMIREDDPKPCSSTPIIPSFPFDEVRGIESWRETTLLGGNNVVVNSLGAEMPTTDFVISRLVGSVDGSRLSITTNCWSHETFDGFQMVDVDKCRTLLVDANQMNNVLHTAKLPKLRLPELNAYTPNLEFLASFQEETGQSVLLFDLSNPANKKEVDAVSHAKKRSYGMMEGSNGGDGDDESSNCLVGKLDGTVTDSFGIESQLSCLSLNRYGTALVGGSMDGDLYLWGR